MLPAEMRVVGRVMRRWAVENGRTKLIVNVSSDWRAPSFPVICLDELLSGGIQPGAAVMMIIRPIGINLQDTGSEVIFRAEKVSHLNEELALQLGLEPRTL